MKRSLIIAGLIGLALCMPFLWPGMMGKRTGYAYGWIPLYSPVLGGYLKRQGMGPFQIAANSPPTNERQVMYHAAYERFSAAAAIYSTQATMFPFIQNYEVERIECNKLRFHDVKIETQ